VSLTGKVEVCQQFAIDYHWKTEPKPGSPHSNAFFSNGQIHVAGWLAGVETPRL